MLEDIEKLLILQDRDRKIIRTRQELGSLDPQRRALQSKLSQAQSGLDAAKLKAKQIETERKKLELEVESKKQQIEKYALQQFQTKKNEEYRALAHEIEMCREAISKLEDQQLELMEQGDQAQKDIGAATARITESKKQIESQIAEIGVREKNLANQAATLEADRDKLAGAVESSALARYERLLKHKGENVVVGIDHGVCGGCHMKLPVQILVSCQARQELVACPNCGRILYYTREMDLVAAE